MGLTLEAHCLLTGQGGREDGGSWGYTLNLHEEEKGQPAWLPAPKLP